MVAPMVAAAGISALGSLAGGLIGSSGAKEAMELQKDAMQKGIRWRVHDAKMAGIHPLYALGAPTFSPSAVNVGQPMADALSSMGQDISRAVAAGQTDAERAIQNLTLEKAQLENDYLREQIASLRVRTTREAGPPVPAIAGLNPEKVVQPQRTSGLNAGLGFKTNPYVSDANSFTDRYGESEILETLLALGIGAADLYHNLPDSSAGTSGISARRASILRRGSRY